MSSPVPQSRESPKSAAALFALFVGAFSVGMAEFVIAGILPQVADAFRIDTGTAGLLVTVYALGVAVGGPILTAATSKSDRKAVLLGAMVVFIAASIGSAVAPSYGALMAGRLVASAAQALFFGVGSVVAADLVPVSRRARAIAVIVSGIAVANVVGIPAGTAIGQLWGWRATFWVLAGVGVASLVMLRLLVPSSAKTAHASFRGELSIVRRPGLLLALAFTLFSYGGIAMLLTYIAPFLLTEAGLHVRLLPLALLAFGVGMLLGGPVGGRVADSNLWRTLLIAPVLTTALLIAVALLVSNGIAVTILLILIGFAGGAVLPAGQLNAIRQANGEGETLASSLNVSAINLGIAAAAGIGAITITQPGIGLSALPWAAAAFTAVAAAVAVAMPLVARNASRNLTRSLERP